MEYLSFSFLYLDIFFLFFFLIINTTYILMNLASGTYMIQREFTKPSDAELATVKDHPPVTIVVPAYNEEEIILDTVQSLLNVEYGTYEIVVVNDGSTDDTLDLLKETYDLESYPGVYRKILETERVREMYQSKTHENLRVIDKENGDKYDALNTGINVAQYPLLTVIDADCVLEPSSLWKVSEMFVRHPETIGVGGSIRILNNCVVENGEIKEIKNSWNPWVLFQNVEYLRSFLFGRVCWNYVNGLMIISGAFGMFRKEALLEVGGYKDTHSNDMEIVCRLHNEYSKKDEPYRIASIPEPVCWTDVPDNAKDFYNQRVVWQKGIADSLKWNSDLLFRDGSGGAGWLGYPYMLFMEGIEAFVEMIGYFYLIIGWSLGIVSTPVLILFLWLAIGLGTIHSVVSLVLEESHFRQYPGKSHIPILFVAAVLENFGYRQLNTLYRCIGLLKWMVGSKEDPGPALAKQEEQVTEQPA